MQAAVYQGPGDIRLEEVPIPQKAADNLLVKVAFCAICGTDLKLATVGYPRCHPPRIIGHEMVGVVEHVGDSVAGFELGDRVTLATTIPCGKCQYCHMGRGNVCNNSKPISYDFDGAFAEYLAVPPEALQQGNAVKVSNKILDKDAALSEPASCAVNGMTLAGVKQGDKVLIVGGGPLGAIHASLCLAYGSEKVMIVEQSEKRLDMLRQISGIQVIDGVKEDVESIVKNATDNLGVDVAIICAPNRIPQQDGLNYVRKGGAVCLFASLPKGDSLIELDSRLIHYNELRIVGTSDSRPEHVKTVLDLLESKKLDFSGVITHELPLSKLHEGLDLMKSRDCLKVLIKPGE